MAERFSIIGDIEVFAVLPDRHALVVQEQNFVSPECEAPTYVTVVAIFQGKIPTVSELASVQQVCDLKLYSKVEIQFVRPSALDNNRTIYAAERQYFHLIFNSTAAVAAARLFTGDLRSLGQKNKFNSPYNEIYLNKAELSAR
ncbi:hypothetical protein CBL_00252 [Carabus blaptoides fortunei]